MAASPYDRIASQSFSATRGIDGVVFCAFEAAKFLDRPTLASHDALCTAPGGAHRR